MILAASSVLELWSVVYLLISHYSLQLDISVEYHDILGDSISNTDVAVSREVIKIPLTIYYGS